MQGQTATITTDYKDYKEVDGVMIPHTSTISGAMPMPLVLEATTIELNKIENSDMFKVEWLTK